MTASSAIGDPATPQDPDPETVPEQGSFAPFPPDYRAGFVAILGKPNAGKSTLLNALTGLHLAAMSDKPQTTRDRIHGIVSREKAQIVFVDTPGVIVPRDKDHFNEALMQRAEEGNDEVDAVLHVVDSADSEPCNPRLEQLLKKIRKAPIYLVLNKADLGRMPARQPSGMAHPSAVPGLSYSGEFRVSALKKRGTEELLDELISLMPLNPPFYDPELPTDRDERFLAAELVREQIFQLLGREVPYAVFVEVLEFREARNAHDKDFISILIYVERESQKPIIIGAGGQMLRRIGSTARREIEQLTGRSAFLELRVKVRKEWRRNPADLGFFGFRRKKSRR